MRPWASLFLLRNPGFGGITMRGERKNTFLLFSVRVCDTAVSRSSDFVFAFGYFYYVGNPLSLHKKRKGRRGRKRHSARYVLYVSNPYCTVPE